MEDQRDVLAEVLEHLGLDPADIPATTLDAVRQALEGPELSPRELAAKVTGGVGRGYASTIRGSSGRRSTVPAEQLEQMSARQLAALVNGEEIQ